MKRRRPRLVRSVGLLALAGLLGLNAWLSVLILAKHDRLPFDASVVPGIDAAAEGPEGGGAGGGGREGSSGDDGPVDDGVALLTDDTPVPGTAIVAGDGAAGARVSADDGGDWPGGRGPVPVGAPEPRQVLLTAAGELRVTGSAPSWSVVMALADALGRRSGLGPLGVRVDEVTWHPDASERIGEGSARLERPLLYDAGQVAVPADGTQVLSPLVALLEDQPALYVVLVAHVDDLGDTEANAAVALARVSAAAEALESMGVASSRVVTAVAPADPAALPGSDEGTQRFNRRVEVRIENLLVPAPTG